MSFSLENGWVNVGSSNKVHKYWTQHWGNTKEPDTLTYDDLAKTMKPDDYIPASTPNSIQLFPPVKIWNTPPRVLLRPEYNLLYEWLNNCESEPSISTRLAMIITGQPGIGKSIFRFFILYRRCREKKPTLLYNSKFLYLFHQAGVAKTTLKDSDESDEESILDQFTDATWLLLDSVNQIPETMMTTSATCRLIITASPADCRRLSKLLQQYLLPVVEGSMKGWSEDELRYGAALFKIEWATICHRHREVGPIPRYLLGVESQYKTFRNLGRISILGLSDEQVRNLLDLIVTPTTDAPDLSHTILYEDRTDPSDPLAPREKHLLSKGAADYVRARLLKNKRQERLALFEHLSGVGRSRSLAGVVYEVHVLDQMLDPNFSLTAELFEMVRYHDENTVRDVGQSKDSTTGGGHTVKVPAKRKGSADTASSPKKRQTRVSQWHTPYGSSSSKQTLQDARRRSLEKPMSITLKSMEEQVYEPGARLQVVPGTLYIPFIVNEACHDAFFLEIVHGRKVLHLLQFTIAEEHPLSKQLIDLRQHFDGVPPLKDWRLIYVQPYQTHLAVPYVKELEEVQHMCFCFPPNKDLKIPKLELTDKENDSDGFTLHE